MTPGIGAGIREGRAKVERQLAGRPPHLRAPRLIHGVPGTGALPEVDEFAQRGLGVAGRDARQIAFAEAMDLGPRLPIVRRAQNVELDRLDQGQRTQGDPARARELQCHHGAIGMSDDVGRLVSPPAAR